jgi:hypothetical protein
LRWALVARLHHRSQIGRSQLANVDSAFGAGPQTNGGTGTLLFT